MLNASILDYTVLITPDLRTGTNKASFTAYCPVLQVFSEGSTVEEALKNVKEAIEVNLEVLAEDGKEIPTERTSDRLVTNARVNVPGGARFAV